MTWYYHIYAPYDPLLTWPTRHTVSHCLILYMPQELTKISRNHIFEGYLDILVISWVVWVISHHESKRDMVTHMGYVEPIIFNKKKIKPLSICQILSHGKLWWVTGHGDSYKSEWVMVSPITHKNHIKSIIFNAAMFHEVIAQKKKQTAFIDQRAALLVKTNTLKNVFYIRDKRTFRNVTKTIQILLDRFMTHVCRKSKTFWGKILLTIKIK